MCSGTPEPIDAAAYRFGVEYRPSSHRPTQPVDRVPLRMALIQIAIELKWLRSWLGYPTPCTIAS